MVMMKPPPMPIDMLWTAPLQNIAAMAASMAVPFRARTFLRKQFFDTMTINKLAKATYFPISAQGLASTETAALE